MFVKAVKISKDAMFPIFVFKDNSKGNVEIGVAGTGFFINSEGCFISVAHAFDNADNKKFIFFGQLPEKLENPNLPIREIAGNDDLDIFIGKIDIKTPKYFRLSEKIPEEGNSVCIGGYPLPNISQDAKGTLQLGGVRRYFQPSFVLDKIVINSKNDSGKIRKHDGFLTRDAGLFGMSGGPIFNKTGIVVGMQGSVYLRESKNAEGKTIKVENAMAIKTGEIIKLLKDNRIMFKL